MKNGENIGENLTESVANWWKYPNKVWIKMVGYFVEIGGEIGPNSKETGTKFGKKFLAKSEKNWVKIGSKSVKNWSKLPTQVLHLKGTEI